MKIDRIMIAAPKSGSGKTTITCTLLQALRDQGKQLVSYKCGPDYIDPMFHKTVLGIDSRNLDTFFTGDDRTRALFLQGCTEEKTAVLEGVMGLYDGLGGIRMEGSSYHLAKVTRTPIILVADAKGMGRSVIALLAGFLACDTEKLIKGVIFNRMGRTYYEALKPIAESELGIRVLGFFPEQKEHIPSRHLGLYMPDELSSLRRQIRETAGELCRTVSIRAVMEIAESAEDIEEEEEWGMLKACSDLPLLTEADPVIAVARDEAFCFSYADNLRMLESCGARLQYFSPLHDKELPEHCSGVLLGGGYPELYAKELSANASMHRSVNRAFYAGMPMSAECGGFLYLHESMQGKDGAVYKMAGVLPGVCTDQGRLVRFGYVEIREEISCFLPKGECIKGHEFHYFDSSDNGTACTAKKPVSGKEYACIVKGDHFWFGFPHLYYPSNPHFAERFVNMARQFLEKRG